MPTTNTKNICANCPMKDDCVFYKPTKTECSFYKMYTQTGSAINKSGTAIIIPDASPYWKKYLAKVIDVKAEIDCFLLSKSFLCKLLTKAYEDVDNEPEDLSAFILNHQQ